MWLGVTYYLLLFTYYLRDGVIRQSFHVGLFLFLWHLHKVSLLIITLFIIRYFII
ncbi:hypothetical protein GLOIN_2v1519693 [Rhizophagus irregularis DAOM 181602=DAOM 197198]|uniref:Uncharacterized protein n=1 Tax=Rhizophagus irregularis (strain DAOM 181602 / DAOM 197198 / MUCL 43194) TaxID=747089 RepID=A0A2P4QRP5_RHIID|nr:hypothetical protein GLOIN_2v1519693 [Rhizophagus irregularis DAOM 181602=DAOM 197198]POG80238.1 hypothetical protein GLOIN_2v1519693 [Rhizophagus irregularis DAOM 181602=DAOM 197198]|eukprot:XP_025187104.1 hypothetical protein GLOIN_2v1519693 [Rhizophagus irregularis DAOM 181602=DAOM 197198]